MKRCTQCGTELQKGTRRCPACGAAQPGASRSILIIVLCVIIAACLILCVVLGRLLSGGNTESSETQIASDVTQTSAETQIAQETGSSQATDTPEDSEEQAEDEEEVEEEPESVWLTYENDACFALKYPSDYLVTEPYDGCVIITESEEAAFQLHAEYAYCTIGNSAIYSAEDFVQQVEADGAVLTDWLGVSEVQVESADWTTVDGRSWYTYALSLEAGGTSYAGGAVRYGYRGRVWLLCTDVGV